MIISKGRFFPVAVCVIALMLLSSCGQYGQKTEGAATQGGGQGIKGYLAYEGKPLQGAYVYAYRRFSTNLLGPADFASEPSGPDGSYVIELTEGTYYVVARKRASGSNTGPIVAGDIYSMHPNNPVTVDPGHYSRADLELMMMRDPMFFQSLSRAPTKTGIKGTIINEKGKPVPWVFAMAYSSSDMKRVPEHTSIMTDADGKFVIYLPKGGTYWLAARKNIRDKPMAGEPYGLYRENSDYSIQVPEGRFKEGVVIKLEKYRKGIQD